MKVTIEEITPNEELKINVRIHFEDVVDDLCNHAELQIFIPQKDYTLSELKQVTLDEARKYLEKCLSDEWTYRPPDWIEPFRFSPHEEEEED